MNYLLLQLRRWKNDMLALAVSDVPLPCINEAAIEYRVPAKLIISVLNVERGRVGMAQKNKNGTYDLGPLQINTSWWPMLYKYHVTPKEVQYNPCTNVKIGAWILASSIANGQNLLSGVGDYHSHTPRYNQTYTQQVRIAYTELTQRLST